MTSWIEIGILIFILILIVISLLLYFIALTNLGKSRAGLIDDENTDAAYSWGSWATLAIIISGALVITNIVLYYYLNIPNTLLKVLLFTSFILLMISGVFGINSYNSMFNIINEDPDDDITTARSNIRTAYIISFIASIFIIIVFIMALFFTNDTDSTQNNKIYL